MAARRKKKRAERVLGPMRHVVVTEETNNVQRPFALQVPTEEREYDRRGNDITGNYHRYLRKLTTEEALALRDCLLELTAGIELLP